MDFLLKPQNDISYNMIAYSYAAGLLICVVLSVLEFIFHIEEVKGFWIIFAPFSICLVWAIVMQRAAAKNIGEQKKKD